MSSNRLRYIADIVLTDEQKERYTKELESDTWKKYSWSCGSRSWGSHGYIKS